jgi:hypothetical protein
VCTLLESGLVHQRLAAAHLKAMTDLLFAIVFTVWASARVHEMGMPRTQDGHEQPPSPPAQP